MRGAGRKICNAQQPCLVTNRMKIHPAKDILQVAGSLGVDIPRFLDVSAAGGLHSYVYEFELEDRRYSLVSLSAFAANYCLRFSGSILYVGATKIWPSDTDSYLLDAALCKMFGIERNFFQDQVVISAETDDQNALSTFFHLAMIFGWDIDCYTHGGKFEIDHDGSITFFLIVDDLNLVQNFHSITDRRLAKLKQG